MGLLWSGSTGFLAVSSALSFASVSFSLPVSGVSVPSSEVAFLYFLFVGQGANGTVFIDTAPTLKDGSGNTRSVDTSGTSLGFGGPGVELGCDRNWSNVASDGGSLTAQFTTALSSFMGCMMGLIVSTQPGADISGSLSSGSASGSSSTAGVTVNRPSFDYPQAGGFGGSVSTAPSLTSSDWTSVVTAQRSFNTAFSSQINLNAGMAVYSGPVGAVPTTMSWSLGSSGSWTARTFTPPATQYVPVGLIGGSNSFAFIVG